MTHAHVSLAPITSYSCPACCCSFGSATELQWHLRTHLEPYLTLGYLFVWPAHAVVVARLGARAFRFRTVAAAPDQETASRHEAPKVQVQGRKRWGAAVDPAGRKPKSKQKSKGGAAGGDSNDHGLVSLVLSLEARLSAVEAATYSVVLVPRETSLPFKNMREAGRKYAQMGGGQGTTRARSGQPAPSRVAGPPVYTGHVRASARSRPSSSGQGRGRQNAAGAGHRAPDTSRTGRVGHDVPRRGLLRQAAAGETGAHPVCHERDSGSVVAPDRPDESNPASSSWAVPASRRNHDEADERIERARLALVRARREAQSGSGPTRRESTSTRQVAPTRPSTTEPSILLLLEGRTPTVPTRRGTPRRL